MSAEKLTQGSNQLRATVHGCGGNPALVSNPEFKLAVADLLEGIAAEGFDDLDFKHDDFLGAALAVATVYLGDE